MKLQTTPTLPRRSPLLAVPHVPHRGSLRLTQSTRSTLCRTAAELDTFLDHHSQQQQQQQDAPAAAAPEPATTQEQFDWHQAWYPLSALTALKQDAPNAVQLLGMRLVVWWDAGAACWRCFEDMCPHRLAPLSEGRLHESGQLQCTYHGWTFDGSGACTSVPQLGDPKAHATAVSSSRSCVKSHPVVVHEGLLWVFGSAQAPGEQQDGPSAALLPPEGYELKSPWFQRDVPLSFDILLENFLDPAHVPHSHHGVIGDRNALHTMGMLPDRPPSAAGGFSLTVSVPVRWGADDYRLDFTPPALVRHDFPGVKMLLYGVPTATGHSRVVMSFLGPKGSRLTRPRTPMLSPLLNWLLDRIDQVPALQHALNRNAIIDGDTFFLHGAERALYGRGDSTSWRRQYFMPSSSDGAVLALRKWLDAHGSKLPVLPKSAADIPPLMPREQVLDRLKQHTEVCPHCSAALRGATIAAGLMAAVAAVAAGSIVAAVIAGSAPLVSPFTGAAAAVAAAAALATAALLKFRQLFIFTDYVHAHVH